MNFYFFLICCRSLVIIAFIIFCKNGDGGSSPLVFKETRHTYIHVQFYFIFFQVIETYETSGTFTAPGTGTYFFTVVAYNRALEASDPVCSDGVTIDTAVPTISEITIENVLVKGGLVTDGTNYWILSTDRTLRKIANHTSDCE